jgi:hypothetical protein
MSGHYCDVLEFVGTGVRYSSRCGSEILNDLECHGGHIVDTLRSVRVGNCRITLLSVRK